MNFLALVLTAAFLLADQVVVVLQLIESFRLEREGKRHACVVLVVGEARVNIEKELWYLEGTPLLILGFAFLVLA